MTASKEDRNSSSFLFLQTRTGVSRKLPNRMFFFLCSDVGTPLGNATWHLRSITKRTLHSPEKIYFFRKKSSYFPSLPGNKVLLVLPPPPPYRIRSLWTLQKRRRCVIAVPFFILLDPWPWLRLLAREMKGSRGGHFGLTWIVHVSIVYIVHIGPSLSVLLRNSVKKGGAKKVIEDIFFLLTELSAKC